jgi:NTE family protein
MMVSPRVGRINLFDFHRARDIIALGAEAAEKSIDAIQESVAALT